MEAIPAELTCSHKHLPVCLHDLLEREPRESDVVDGKGFAVKKSKEVVNPRLRIPKADQI
jgi:hypothetical protein